MRHNKIKNIAVILIMTDLPLQRCIACVDHEYLEDEKTCRECDIGWWPNQNKTGCVQLDLQYVKWNSLFAIIPSVLSVIGKRRQLLYYLFIIQLGAFCRECLYVSTGQQTLRPALGHLSKHIANFKNYISAFNGQEIENSWLAEVIYKKEEHFEIDNQFYISISVVCHQYNILLHLACINLFSKPGNSVLLKSICNLEIAKLPKLIKAPNKLALMQQAKQS